MVIESELDKAENQLQENERLLEENWNVKSDHCYARPWNWKSEMNFLKPTKTLFATKQNKSLLTVLNRTTDQIDNIDVETIDEENQPEYDVNKSLSSIQECEKLITSFKNIEKTDWEEDIQKHNWTATQMRLFNGMVNILNQHRLGKLAYVGVNYEAICRRTIIDKSVKRLRLLMSTIFWDCKLTQWLHQLLMEYLSADYLTCYIEILQTLKTKLPQFVDKMINGHSNFRLGSITTENLLPILKRPWDLTGTTSLQDKLKKLPSNPVIVIVPSCSMVQTRLVKWINLFSLLATVINIPVGFGLTGQKLTMTQCADQMYSIVKAKIQEIKADYPGRNLVLVGFNAGASLALQIAQTEPVVCVICMGFSLLTAKGKRGEPDDALMELQCPVLFVMGQCSTVASTDEMEDLRERMRVETGLVVVGSADNNLRISKKKKREQGITQSMLDGCIVEEVGEFISGLILSPFPPQIRQSPTQVATEPPSAKKQKLERHRYNSTASSLDSEDLIGSVPTRISRPVGRPPGSKSKPRLEAKWAAQVQQGTSSSSQTLPDSLNASPTALSPPSTPINFESSSDDSFSPCLSGNEAKSLSLPSSPVSSKVPKPSRHQLKKIKTLLPVQKIPNAEKFSLSSENKSDKVHEPSQLRLTVKSSATRSSLIKNNQPTSAGTNAAKLQAYGMTKHNIVSGSWLSTLLQGGIKTIPPSAPKAASTKIRVLENIKLPPNSKYVPKITVFNTSSSGIKPTGGGNVIILPDGKVKTIGHGGVYKTTPTRYITSKKQLMGNSSSVRSLKKNSLPSASYRTDESPLVTSVLNLPPPTNLTCQDIMDLPIIFADDDSGLLPELPAAQTPNKTTPTKFVTSTPANFSEKNISPVAIGNKYVLINKPTTAQQNVTSNFEITTVPLIKNSTLNVRKQPKYTKIILSKRLQGDEKSKPANVHVSSSSSSNIVSRLVNLSPEISLKKISPSVANDNKIITMENIDLEKELIATTIAKPLEGKSITVVPQLGQSVATFGVTNSVAKTSSLLENT